ncbi:hypothetical protein [Arenibaculum pallidiluteum]|uniref:hypothetical protein n=1 Tax=Arenibaculum pallidiluteum TaxID=2812559 RepID=UPI001A957F26|nr:hypothetical protein [Arenibaculum pallidiluteum]
MNKLQIVSVALAATLFSAPAFANEGIGSENLFVGSTDLASFNAVRSAASAQASLMSRAKTAEPPQASSAGPARGAGSLADGHDRSTTGPYSPM